MPGSTLPSGLVGLRFPTAMTGGSADSDLDQILSLQLTVAWAGEALCQPPRLGWWRTDLVDEAGGGDLFARLTPRLQRWSALEAALETARRVDEQRRREVAEPGKVRTLFHLGFHLDERLGTRLSVLKASEAPPEQAFPIPLDLKAAFSRDSLAVVLGGLLPGVKYATVLGGREVKGAVLTEPGTLARQLAAALVPFAERYPMPFARTSS